MLIVIDCAMDVNYLLSQSNYNGDEDGVPDWAPAVVLEVLCE